MSDIESTRSFEALIAVIRAVLDEVRTRLGKPLLDLWRIVGSSKAAAALAPTAVWRAATVAASLTPFWLRVFLALLGSAMLQEVRMKIGKPKFQTFPAGLLETTTEMMEILVDFMEVTRR